MTDLSKSDLTCVKFLEFFGESRLLPQQWPATVETTLFLCQTRII